MELILLWLWLRELSEPIFLVNRNRSSPISGGLAGIITVGGGLDLYHPLVVIPLAFSGAFIMPKVAAALERTGIDDAVGAFAVHGFCGTLGAILPGFFAYGYPQAENIPVINPIGQIVPTLICIIILGFIPGYGVSFVLKKLGLLRVSRAEEIEGLDLADMGVEGYPEYNTTWRSQNKIHDSSPVGSSINYR